MIGGGSYHLASGMVIAADHIVMKTLSATAPPPGIESASFQGHVTITQGGAIVKADEAKYDPDTHEFVLAGNVRVVVPAESPSVK